MMPDEFDAEHSEIGDDLAEQLREMLREENPSKPWVDPNHVDPRTIRADDNSSWSDVVGGDSFPELIHNLLVNSVLLPRADFQIPIAASYLMLPSVFCNRVPILCSQGGSGTGKSTLSHLACGIHGVDPLGSGSTFPSIRNQIRNTRFYDTEVGSRGTHNEKNMVLAWEDINSQSLRTFEGNIFNLLKLGVDRKGKISIASTGGNNMEFEVFSPKLISSIHPFYAEHEFRELIRRIIVIEHKRHNLYLTSDESEIQANLDPDDLIDLGSLDWSGCKKEFDDFWLCHENATRFAETRRKVKKPKGSGFPTAYFDISRDLIAVGVVCGYFESVSSAIEHFRLYYDWHKNKIESQATGTEMLLREFIASKVAQYDSVFDSAKARGVEDMLDPFRIEPKEIQEFLLSKQRDGELDIAVTPRERTNVMEALGYRLKPDPGSHSNYWYPATE